MTLSEADRSHATIKSGEKRAVPVAGFAGGWREGLLVLAMVLAPVGLAVILTAASVLAIAAWQAGRGLPIELPTRSNLQLANLQLLGMLAYVVGSWFDVAAVWFWSQRRGIFGDVFASHGLTWPAMAAGLAGFLIAMYGAPPMTQWLSHMVGEGGPTLARVDFHGAHAAAIYVLLFVITAPLCEEILYRGLLVAWLRRIGWRDSEIFAVGSLIFGANHIIPLGLVWSVVMVGLGAILFALRLRYNSLTPAWLAHFLFNAHPLLILPLIDRFAPALHPGSLS
jgi:membrane protease YdiL (CAAX protease family)